MSGNHFIRGWLDLTDCMWWQRELLWLCWEKNPGIQPITHDADLAITVPSSGGRGSGGALVSPSPTGPDNVAETTTHTLSVALATRSGEEAAVKQVTFDQGAPL
jgi:hypothetical protein